MEQQFYLKWNNHNSTLLNMMNRLLRNEKLVDVTLSAEGQVLTAHKIVLSACSSYFELLFSKCPADKHPIVFLKDVKYDNLKCLLHYMYHGEVNVSQEQLPDLIRAAESLKIKGLAEDSDEKSNRSCKAFNDSKEISKNPLSKKDDRISDSICPSKKSKINLTVPLDSQCSPETPCEVSVTTQRIVSPSNTFSTPAYNPDKSELSLTYNPCPIDEKCNSNSKTSSSIKEEISVDDETVCKTKLDQEFSNFSESDDPGYSNWSLDVDPHVTPSLMGPNDSQQVDRLSSKYTIIDSPNGNVSFACIACHRTYRVKSAVVRHVRYECGNRKCFRCPDCCKSFAQKPQLSSHILSIHNKKTTIDNPCPECSLMFKDKLELKNHLHLEHYQI